MLRNLVNRRLSRFSSSKLLSASGKYEAPQLITFRTYKSSSSSSSSSSSFSSTITQDLLSTKTKKLLSSIIGLGALTGAYLGYQYMTAEEAENEAPWWQRGFVGLGKAHNCGIIAFVGPEPATNYLLEGLTILQNRGYDSAGVSSIRQKSDGSADLVTTKYASVGSTSDSIDLLKKKAPSAHQKDGIGIAHTRWATHGGKTDENAHPHSDMKNRLALVHNGTIENSQQIKEELEGLGYKFKSQTDTEVIVQLIGHYLDKKVPLVDATKKALARLEGTWGIAMISREQPDQIIAARNGSPIIIGLGKDRMFVASEIAAFSRYTNQYISLNDGEVAVIKADGVSLDLSRVEKAHEELIELSPSPYPHWTIKEIMEQPEAIARTLNYGGRLSEGGTVKLGGLQANADLLLTIKHLVIAACGTSYFAGQYGARLMRTLKCFDTVETYDASEVGTEHLPWRNGGMLVISQSGETKDTHRALRHAEAMTIPRFSVINQVGSLIARSTRCGVYINAGREHAVASTKAFTTQVAALALVAGWFSQNRPQLAGNPNLNGNLSSTSTSTPQPASSASDKSTSKSDSKHAKDAPTLSYSQSRTLLLEAIHRLPTYTGMTLRARDKCKAVASKLKNSEHIFILGKGYAEPIAYEGALKIKEIGYIHAEGYSGGALKHGPFALLEQGTPVILLILDDQHAELMRIAAQEVKARGAYNIVVTDNPKLANGVADDVITIPSNGPLTALLAVIPLQLLAYEISIQKGINPDKPRHLAKAVTVD